MAVVNMARPYHCRVIAVATSKSQLPAVFRACFRDFTLHSSRVPARLFAFFGAQSQLLPLPVVLAVGLRSFRLRMSSNTGRIVWDLEPCFPKDVTLPGAIGRVLIVERQHRVCATP